MVGRRAGAPFRTLAMVVTPFSLLLVVQPALVSLAQNRSGRWKTKLLKYSVRQSRIPAIFRSAECTFPGNALSLSHAPVAINSRTSELPGLAPSMAPVPKSLVSLGAANLCPSLSQDCFSPSSLVIPSEL